MLKLLNLVLNTHSNGTKTHTTHTATHTSQHPPPKIGIRALDILKPKRLEYLGLEITPNIKRLLVLTDKNKIKCNFEKDHQHNFFSIDPCLNTIIDLLINISDNQESKIENIQTTLSTLNKEISSLNNKLDYIKDQNKNILEKIYPYKAEDKIFREKINSLYHKIDDKK